MYGDLQALKRLAKVDKASLFAEDENGWQPMHEAARVGHTRVVQFLIEQGADVNARTHLGGGASAMHIAIEALVNNDHAVVQLLQKKANGI